MTPSGGDRPGGTIPVVATAAERYAFSVDEPHAMGDAGIFDEDSRVELIDGEVVSMAPIGNRHLACVNRLTRLLVTAVGDEAVVSVHNPVRLGERSEPQPDLVLLRPRPDDYGTHSPGAADTRWWRSPTPRSPGTATSRHRCTPPPLYRSTGSST